MFTLHLDETLRFFKTKVQSQQQKTSLFQHYIKYIRFSVKYQKIANNFHNRLHSD